MKENSPPILRQDRRFFADDTGDLVGPEDSQSSIPV
jgi:hypothetical protein